MAIGWKHKDFWILHWADSPMPEIGKTIVHSWGDKYKVKYVEDDIVVLKKLKLKKVI